MSSSGESTGLGALSGSNLAQPWKDSITLVMGELTKAQYMWLFAKK